MAEMPPLVKKIYDAYGDARRRQMAWVMDVEWWKQIRRQFRFEGDEPDESKWKPEDAGMLMGRPIVVRHGGGEPHIEWLTGDEIAAAATPMTADDWQQIEDVLRHYGCGGCSNPDLDKELRQLADKMMTWLTASGAIQPSGGDDHDGEDAAARRA